MRVIIYSGYNNGLGDLNFGKKLAAEVHAKYPDATIEFVTSSTKKLQSKKEGASDVESFNKNNAIQVTPIDKFLESGKKGDIVIVGPVLTMKADEVSALAANKNTPIMLSLEYDFNALWHMDDLIAELKIKKFENIVKMPTGLGEGKSGIFLNKSDTFLDKKNQPQVNTLFREGLPITGDIIRGGKDPEVYLAKTNVTVSYSHNNAERLFSVHKEIASPDKNSDVIIMGELKCKEKMIKALMTGPSPLDKGFSKIIY
jgi:cellobiose-specific phosphotransferase system component IIB